jgi:hypothetical protein
MIVQMKVREIFSFRRIKGAAILFALFLAVIGSLFIVTSTHAAGDVVLTGSAFSDPDAEDTHKSSQWVITDASGGGNTIYDSGTDAVNLTTITVSGAFFSSGTTYYWKVRYQDNHDVWSDYSDESSFAYGDAPTATPTDTPTSTLTAAPTDTPTAIPTSTLTCTDGIRNGDETGVDCGGSCSACSGPDSCSTLAVDHITITPSSTNTTVNASRNFVAKLYKADDTLITDGIVTWETTGGAIIDNGDDSAGWVAPATTGTYTVTAKSCGKEAVATIVVSNNTCINNNCNPDDPIKIASIKITASPDQTFLKPGQTQQYSAKVIDRSGADITSTCPVTWSMQVPTAGNINASGLMTATGSLGVWTDSVKATANCFDLTDFDLLSFVTANEARRLEYAFTNPWSTAVKDPIKTSQYFITGYDQFNLFIPNANYSMSLLDSRIGTIPTNGRIVNIATSNNYGCYPNKVKGTAVYDGVEKSAFGSIAIYPTDYAFNSSGSSCESSKISLANKILARLTGADRAFGAQGQVFTSVGYGAPSHLKPGQTAQYYGNTRDQAGAPMTGVQVQYILHNPNAGQLAANGKFIATTNIGSYPGAIEIKATDGIKVISRTFNITITNEQRKAKNVYAYGPTGSTDLTTKKILKMWKGSNYSFYSTLADQFQDPVGSVNDVIIEDVSGQNLVDILGPTSLRAKDTEGTFTNAIKVTYDINRINSRIVEEDEKILGPSPVIYLTLDIHAANDNPSACLTEHQPICDPLDPECVPPVSQCLYDFVSPQQGDKWTSGSLQQITWVSKDSTASANTKVNVFLLTNNGQLKTSIAMMQNDDGILPYQVNPRNSASSGEFQLDTYDSDGKQISSCTSPQLNFNYPSEHNPPSTANIILVLGSLLATILSYLLSIVAAIPSLSRTLSSIILAMFAPPVWLRQKSKWGIVYDALTKKPIPNVVVRMFSEPDGKLRDSRRSNEVGEFGFIVPMGTYSVTASKSGYSFPSHLVVGSSDNQYHNIYKGGEVDVHPTEGGKAPLNINIPLDQTKANILDITVLSTLHFISKVVSVIRIPLLVLGTVFSVYLTITQGRWFDYLILIFYAALWAYEIADLMKKRTYGVVSDDSSQPVALAMIRVIDKANKLRATVVTGDDGKFTIPLPRGEYRFEASRAGYVSDKSEYLQIAKMADVGKVNLRLKKLVDRELYPEQDHSKL